MQDDSAMLENNQVQPAPAAQRQPSTNKVLRRKVKKQPSQLKAAIPAQPKPGPIDPAAEKRVRAPAPLSTAPKLRPPAGATAAGPTAAGSASAAGEGAAPAPVTSAAPAVPKRRVVKRAAGEGRRSVKRQNAAVTSPAAGAVDAPADTDSASDSSSGPPRTLLVLGVFDFYCTSDQPLATFEYLGPVRGLRQGPSTPAKTQEFLETLQNVCVVPQELLDSGLGHIDGSGELAVHPAVCGVPTFLVLCDEEGEGFDILTEHYGCLCSRQPAALQLLRDQCTRAQLAEARRLYAASSLADLCLLRAAGLPGILAEELARLSLGQLRDLAELLDEFQAELVVVAWQPTQLERAQLPVYEAVVERMADIDDATFIEMPEIYYDVHYWYPDDQAMRTQLLCHQEQDAGLFVESLVDHSGERAYVAAGYQLCLSSPDGRCREPELTWNDAYRQLTSPRSSEFWREYLAASPAERSRITDRLCEAHQRDVVRPLLKKMDGISDPAERMVLLEFINVQQCKFQQEVEKHVLRIRRPEAEGPEHIEARIDELHREMRETCGQAGSLLKTYVALRAADAQRNRQPKSSGLSGLSGLSGMM